MTITSGIRTDNLRKVFNTPAPAGVAGPRSAGFGARGSRRTAVKAEVVALDGLSLEVRGGEIFGLLGPNGAGKSTTVGILTTRVQPTSGVAWIGGLNVWQERVKVKHLIGVVPQRPNLDFGLTAREILLFHAAYFGVPAAERARRAAELLDRFKLVDRADHLFHGFSGGMMQRLSIARALMPGHYKSLLLPGIIAMSMVMTGIWAVAMPLVSEFQFTREIDDRLLAPMEVEWVAIEKVVAGYPWSALSAFPILQRVVLINPLVYASEGFRSTLAPQFPHLSKTVIVSGLTAFDVGIVTLGLRQFRKKAVS